MKRPSFQFYPADWRNNANLRRCSEAARGVWMDVLCLLHDSDEYGVLRWPLRDIAQAAGVSLALLRELVEKNVLKGGDGGCEAFLYIPRHAGKIGEPKELVSATDKPCWYCGRMVRDEYMRGRRGVGTRFEEGHTVRSGAKDKSMKKSSSTDAPDPSPTAWMGEGAGEGATSTSSSSFTSSSSKHKNMCVWVEGDLSLNDARPVPAPADFPDPERLETQMLKAGRSPPSPQHLQAQLVLFRLHFHGRRMRLSVWYSKLLAWLLRNPEETHDAGTRTHQRAAGQPQGGGGFTQGDAISEQWARTAGG